MKIFKSTIILIISLFLITGCKSEKTLICTKTSKVAGIEFVETITNVFEKNQVISATLNGKVNLGNYAEHSDEALEELLASFNVFKDLSGVMIYTSNQGESVAITAEIDLKKMTEEDKQKIGLSKTGNYKSIKSNMEKDGYTCK